MKIICGNSVHHLDCEEMSMAGWRSLRFMRVAVLCFVVVCSSLADVIDSRPNPVTGSPPPPAQADEYARMFIADLHADTLLWNRDLLRRGRWGHVDVPRLQAGGVDLQVFTVVTKTPPERRAPGPGDRHCIPGADINLVGLHSVIQMRDSTAWFDLRQRALYQGSRLREAIERSGQGRATRLMAIHTS